jgi:hypothetical protein
MANALRSVHEHCFSPDHSKHVAFRAGSNTASTTDAREHIDVRMHGCGCVQTGNLELFKPTLRSLFRMPHMKHIWHQNNGNQDDCERCCDEGV